MFFGGFFAVDAHYFPVLKGNRGGAHTWKKKSEFYLLSLIGSKGVVPIQVESERGPSDIVKIYVHNKCFY